jgi:hypothetical protein
MQSATLEIHLEELGQHSWIQALLNTVTGSNGSAQFRFVARPPGDDHARHEHERLGASFPMLRFQDLDYPTEPNAWLDTARERLDELDRELEEGGWQRQPGAGRHWWSLSYVRASSGTCDPPERDR